MEEPEENALFSLNKLVENLDIQCVPKSGRKEKTKNSFTNFSIQEILKPSFGSLKCGYDSDSAYTSDTNDSSDDAVDRDYLGRVTPERPVSLPACFHHEHPTKKKQVKSLQEPISSWMYRIRRQIEDDGYSSSDSESALDLRIERKKTPPKWTGQLPAWVFCTRYSDRPSAGNVLLVQKNITRIWYCFVLSSFLHIPHIFWIGFNKYISGFCTIE